MAKETTPSEPTFSAAEIAANAPRLFGKSIDMATAAFEFNKVSMCTLAEAESIIKSFAERKVE